MSIAIAIALSLMEHYKLMLSQRLIIENLIERIDKVRRHALDRIKERDEFILGLEHQIPIDELREALGIDDVEDFEQVPGSQIRGDLKALCGLNSYTARSLAAGCRRLIAELRPASDEERQADEEAFRNRIMELAVRYSSLTKSERTKVLVNLEGTRTREQSEMEELTQLVKLRIDGEFEYEHVLNQLRSLQEANRITQEPLCDPRFLCEEDLTLHIYLYRDEVRRLSNHTKRADNRRHEQLQEAS